MPIWGWSLSRTCSIDWLSCTRHCRSSCTYSVRDLCRHSYYDSHRSHCWNRTEQHRQLGKLKNYYLDKFNQTGVFIRHKRGMQNSVAIKDRREGSLPNNWPLLPTTVSIIIPWLCIRYVKLLRDTFNGNLQPQPWHHNAISLAVP